MKDDFKATFWGVRGSYPVPGKDTVYFGGRTTCVEVRVSNVTIIIDAGTGIIPLGNVLTANHFKENADAPLELTVLFTHLHHDHTQGLPFFTPLYLGQSRLSFFGPLNFDSELQTVLERSMTPPNFPVDLRNAGCTKQFSTIGEQHLVLFHLPKTTPILVNRFQDTYEIRDNTIVVRILVDFSHPANSVLVYRIEYGGKTLVFATDVEGYIYGNAKLIHFAEGADVLIHDAQYSAEQYTALPTPRQGFGHSIPEMAIEVGKKAGVKSLVLTHHDPTTTDAQLKKYFTKYKRRFPALLMAREGLTLHLS
jgi:phosphoribosyl 1,2-cyclic phosphodiesterase